MPSNLTQNFINFSRPFVDASKVIFETMIFTKIQTQKPSIKSDSTSHGDISAILGLAGRYESDNGQYDFRGLLVLSWPFETYVKIANSMLGENHTKYNEGISDVGAEISNMIMGNAKRELKGLGYSLNMAIPSTVSGKDHTINYPPNSITILIPIETAHGPFYMELCYAVQNP